MRGDTVIIGHARLYISIVMTTHTIISGCPANPVIQDAKSFKQQKNAADILGSWHISMLMFSWSR